MISESHVFFTVLSTITVTCYLWQWGFICSFGRTVNKQIVTVDRLKKNNWVILMITLNYIFFRSDIQLESKVTDLFDDGKKELPKQNPPAGIPSTKAVCITPKKSHVNMSVDF